MSELPPDILYNIFSRMPIQSLARLQCVCKLWYEYILNPYYANIHVNKETIPIMYQQFPDAYPNKRCVISFLTINQSNTPVEAKKSSIWEFSLEETVFLDRKDVLGSCNGLLLVCLSKDRQHGIVRLLVINPLRKERHELPPMRIFSGVFLSEVSFGFGFDDSTNTFKIVCVIHRKLTLRPDLNMKRDSLCTMVHVLGADSWREVHQVPFYGINGEAVYAHGCLYWFAKGCLDLWSTEKGKKIVSFDLKKEEFGLIHLPKQNGDQLVDLNGELGLVYKIINISIEIWILKDKEVGYEVWVVKCGFFFGNGK